MECRHQFSSVLWLHARCQEHFTSRVRVLIPVKCKCMQRSTVYVIIWKWKTSEHCSACSLLPYVTAPRQIFPFSGALHYAVSRVQLCQRLTQHYERCSTLQFYLSQLHSSFLQITLTLLLSAADILNCFDSSKAQPKNCYSSPGRHSPSITCTSGFAKLPTLLLLGN